MHATATTAEHDRPHKPHTASVSIQGAFLDTSDVVGGGRAARDGMLSGDAVEHVGHGLVRQWRTAGVLQ